MDVAGTVEAGRVARLVTADDFVALVAEVTEFDGPLGEAEPLASFDSMELLMIAVLFEELGATIGMEEWQHLTGDDATLGDLHGLLVIAVASRSVS